MKIIVAPNAFKGSLFAPEAADAISAGLKGSKLKADTVKFPVGDGGTGTGELITAFLAGDVVAVSVVDPLNRPITAAYGLIDSGQTAVIDIASASGIHLLSPDELDPIVCTSYGVGQLVLDALDRGARKILIGVGGTATVDGGAGILYALGLQFFDKEGACLTDIPADLHRVDHIDFSRLDSRLSDCEFVLLCDVINPLFGDEGGIHMFSPQKGASEGQVLVLEKTLSNYFEALKLGSQQELSSMMFGGAAGGISAGLHVALNAKLVHGIDYFLEVTGFAEFLRQADLVVTGEGSIDEQTLCGKAPFGVARLAKSCNLPVVCLAGVRPKIISADLNAYFDAIFSIGEGPADLSSAMKSTEDNLFETSRQLGNLLSMKNNTTDW